MKVTKQFDIFNKVKTGFAILLVFCFAAFNAYEVNAQVTPQPKGNSVVYKNLPSDKSSTSDYYARQGKKALNKSTERLHTGAAIAAVSPVAGALYTAAPLVSYVRTLIGDTLNDGLTALEGGVNKGFEAFENFLPEGLIKNLLVDYNVGYQLLKFATKGVVKVAKFLNNVVFGQSNRDCNVERMNAIYKNGCYSCVLVKSLISSFITACSKVYDISREAGIKILALGLMLWIAFFVLQQVSSFKNIEPAAMVNTMLVMAFKALGAYVVITAGITFFIDYTIVPLMGWGADFGMMLLLSSSAASGIQMLGTELDPSYLTHADSILPAHLLNNIMTYIAAVDGTVSTHMQIGHMVTCHASRVGSFEIFGLFKIVNFWIWICGAAIWFCGFMMTLAVAYYLVDMSFKLGFAIIALPIVVALWPFNLTKDKLTTCLQIILKSAFIFVFLAMTTAAGLALVSNALDAGSNADQLQSAAIQRDVQAKELSGTQKLFLAVEEGDADYISERFSLFGPSFILILFAYLYAIKIIGSTVSEYVNKFAPDSVFGDSSPMHQKMTQATDFAKQKVTKAAKFGGKVAKVQGKKALKGVAAKFGGGKGIIDKLKGAKGSVDKLSDGDLSGESKDDSQPKDKLESAKQMTNMQGKDKQGMKDADSGKGGGGAGGGGSGGGSGESLKKSGEALEKGADAMKNTAKTAKQTSQSARQASQSVSAGGKAATATVVGAPVGVVAVAAGKAGETGAMAAEKTAEAAESMAEIMKQTGKIIKETGKQMEKAEKATKPLKKAMDGAKKASETLKDSGSKEEEKDSGNPQSGGGNDDLIEGIAKGASGKKK